MTEKLMAAFAFVVLAGFLGILAWWVPRFDLLAVIGATLLLTFYDLFFHERRLRRR